FRLFESPTEGRKATTQDTGYCSVFVTQKVGEPPTLISEITEGPGNHEAEPQCGITSNWVWRDHSSLDLGRTHFYRTIQKNKVGWLLTKPPEGERPKVRP